MKIRHYLVCEAPICNDDPNPDYKDEVIWVPGELICQKGPYHKFQKKQVEINRCVAKGKFKNVDVPYTAHDLENKSI